jgi:hypothetical protein
VSRTRTPISRICPLLLCTKLFPLVPRHGCQQVPLNAIVCVTLVYVGQMSQNVVFALIMGWLMLGWGTLKSLRKAPAAAAGSSGP